MPKQFAKRIADVGRLEIAGCPLVKHRGKESEVIFADKCDLDVGALCCGAIEVSRGPYAGESAPQNNDLRVSSFPIDFMHHVRVPQVWICFLLPFKQSEDRSGRL
jgi:hypothetical protein